MPKPPDIPLSEEDVMTILQQYGTEFHIFEFEDQPNVFARPERQEPHALKSGKVNPRALQHWLHLEDTRSLLRQRYGLFPKADLLIDCPLKQMRTEKEQQPEQTRKKFFRLYVDEGMIAFTCNARTVCPKKRCAAKRRSVLDIYDLIAWLDGKNLNHAKKVVAEHFKVDLGNFPRAESKETNDADQEQAELSRYAVSKVKLRNLFTPQDKKSKKGSVDTFIQKAVDLICNSPEAPYDGYNGRTETTVLLSKRFDNGQQLTCRSIGQERVHGYGVTRIHGPLMLLRTISCEFWSS